MIQFLVSSFAQFHLWREILEAWDSKEALHSKSSFILSFFLVRTSFFCHNFFIRADNNLRKRLLLEKTSNEKKSRNGVFGLELDRALNFFSLKSSLVLEFKLKICPCIWYFALVVSSWSDGVQKIQPIYAFHGAYGLWLTVATVVPVVSPWPQVQLQAFKQKPRSVPALPWK